MRFNCDKTDLLYGVATVCRAITGKSTIPITNGILIESVDGGIELRATNTEIDIQCFVPVDVVERGVVVVADGKRFSSIIKALPDVTIEVSTINDGDLKIDYGISTINIKGFEGDDFPQVPDVEGVCGRIPSEVFCRVVKQASVAVSNDPIQPMLTGLLMEINSDKITFVATDFHRLSYADTVWESSGESKKVIVPSKALFDMVALSSNDEDVYLVVGDKNIAMQCGNVTIACRLLSGQFPDYKSIIPSEDKFTNKTVIDRSDLTASLKRAALFGNDENHTVRLNFGSNGIEMSAMQNNTGSIKETLKSGNLDGKSQELLMGYNLKYLLDFLAVSNSDNVVFSLTNNLGAGTMTEEDNDNFVYIILPLRLVR